MDVYKVNEELNKQLKEVSSYTAQFTAEAGSYCNFSAISCKFMMLCLQIIHGPSILDCINIQLFRSNIVPARTHSRELQR